MNQFDTATFVLVGTGILIVLVLIWLLGLRRQATTDARHPTVSAGGEPRAEVVRREPQPDLAPRRGNQATGPQYASRDGGQSGAPIRLPAPLAHDDARSEGRYGTRNGENYSLSSGRSTAVASADRPATATDAERFQEEQVRGLRSRWGTIQSQFVDEPRESVEEADQLVSEALDHVESLLAAQRTNLRRRWESENRVSTDDLRSALQDYRSFFERLLAA